ncbi:MAG: hypothetical protein ACRC0A_00730 [Chitinophagaceae bacterium]
MGLNDFKINTITASNFYHENITLGKIPSDQPIDHKKDIVIIINTEVNKEYKIWLEKVLAYCKLSIDNAHLLTFSKEKNIEMILSTFNPSQIWLFGISFHALGMKSIKTIHFEISTYNGLTCLPLPRIETFFDNQIMKEHKRALMYFLKKLFQIA